MRCLLIGPISGYQSYSVVCKGLIRGLLLSDSELEVVAADTTWDGSGGHTEPELSRIARGRLRWLPRSDTQLLLRGEAPEQDVGDVCIALNPSAEMLNIRKLGMKLAGMHVGDVDKLPSLWKHVMDEEDQVLVPSQWMASIAEAAAVDTPLMVVNHGVGPDFVLDEGYDAPRQPPFVFMHACAAVYYPERKGTPQALEAFTRLVDEGHDVVLRLVVGNKTKPVRALLDRLSASASERLQLYSQAGGRPQDSIADAYRSCHALLAPSRAEGFGLMPIESRAVGTPVVQTLCTGFADHVPPEVVPAEWGLVVVPHGELAASWTSVGRAPSVNVDDVCDAMRACMEDWADLKTAALHKAEAVAHSWAWEVVTKPLTDWIHSNR